MAVGGVAVGGGGGAVVVMGDEDGDGGSFVPVGVMRQDRIGIGSSGVSSRL